MLNQLNDAELLLSTKSAIEIETKASTNVVRHFFEIERRELFLKRGFSSLYIFAQEEFGLDSTSAQRRINAVELAKSVPEVLAFFDQGRLQLSSAADIQTFLNAERGRGKPLNNQQKAELVETLLDLSTREIQRRLAHKNPQVTFSDSRKLISETQYRVIYITRIETEEKLEQIRSVRSHVNPYATRDELINDICEIALEKIDPARRAARAQKRADAKAGNIEPLPAPEVTFVDEVVSEVGEIQVAARFESPSRYIPAHERHRIYEKQLSTCSFKDDVTGRICGSTHQHQLDHIISFAQGGANTAANLQPMCARHNRYRYKTQARTQSTSARDIG